jgi:hypothetical protein
MWISVKQCGIGLLLAPSQHSQRIDQSHQIDASWPAAATFKKLPLTLRLICYVSVGLRVHHLLRCGFSENDVELIKHVGCAPPGLPSTIPPTDPAPTHTAQRPRCMPDLRGPETIQDVGVVGQFWFRVLAVNNGSHG